jgi:hypothetical protein
MAKFMKQIGRWTDGDKAALIDAFGAAELHALIEARVVCMMARYAGEDPGHVRIPAARIGAAAQSVFVPEECIRDRISTMVYEAMGVSRRSTRSRRKRELVEYARRGIRTLAEIRAADAGQMPLAFSTPAPTPAPVAPRTLDTIAAELREARATAARISVECKAAEDRMVALGAEFQRAVREVYE